MAITNYRACGKTKAPAACSIDCCGTKFGRAHIHHALRPQSSSPKRKMRRYARHADKRLIRREVEMELQLLSAWEYEPITDEQDEYYRLEFERSLLDDGWDSDRDERYSCYDEYDYPGDYDPLDGLFDIPVRYRDVHPLFDAIQKSFHNGEISRQKYYRLVDTLNSRD